MNQKVRPDDYALIHDMKKEGARHKDIAEFFNVSPETISYVLAKTRQRKRTINRKRPTDDELYQSYIIEDLKQQDIATRYDVSLTTAKRWLRQAELTKYRDDEGIVIPHNKLERPDDEELYRLYILEGKSQVQLMAHYGISRTTVYHWLAEAEITKRGPYNKGEMK